MKVFCPLALLNNIFLAFANIWRNSLFNLAKDLWKNEQNTKKLTMSKTYGGLIIPYSLLRPNIFFLKAAKFSNL